MIKKQILMILLPIIFFGSLLLIIINKINKTKPVFNEDFSPTPTSRLEILDQTKYATDSALLEIRQVISKLKEESEKLNGENNLLPPKLNFGLEL